MDSFKPNNQAKPESFSFISPGISPEVALLSEHLLNRNNKEFHCFFNDRKFHNHTIHHLLAAYSLGASKEKIQEIFDIHASYQRLLPPSVGTFSRLNYKEYLGQSDSYASFLALFQSEIKENGPVDTVRRWVWSGDMLSRALSGTYHPIIHIGYGLEFNIPGIVAEGLAMAACTDDEFADLVPEQKELQVTALLPVYVANATGEETTIVDQLSDQISSNLGVDDKSSLPSLTTESNLTEKDTIPIFLKENTLFPILTEMTEDPAFNDIFEPTDVSRIKVLLKNKSAIARVKEYAGRWSVEENTKDIQAKFKDLHTLAVTALGSAGLRKEHGDILKLDFFLMHTLTSSGFLRQYLSKIAPSEAVSLLRAHLSVTLAYFVSIGRPKFDVEALLAYKSPNQDKMNNTWFGLFEKSLNCKEPHVIKVVRACAVGQILYGSHQDPHLNAIWLQVAQMAIDKNGEWAIDGVGFDRHWAISQS